MIERSGDPVARLVPLRGASPTLLRDALAAWSKAGGPEAAFADALELVGSPPKARGSHSRHPARSSPPSAASAE